MYCYSMLPLVLFTGITGFVKLIQAQDTNDTSSDNNAFQRTINVQEAVVCDCGFIDENNNVWTDIWYANFQNYNTALQYDPHYQLMDYTVGVKHKDAFERVFKPANVKKNINGSIALSVKKSKDGQFTSAAFGTKRNDFMYGTYRARMKTTNITGTVAAFYYYRNSTSEIDMEALSRFTDPHKVYFAIQPQIYENGVASNLTSEKHDLEFNPNEDYHEYRFDWLPGSVKFYVDGIFVREMVTNVPSSPGRILINHWTDGNPNFSAGPPSQDAHLYVSNLNLFFNTSNINSSQLTCFRSKTPCRVSDIMNKQLLPGSEMNPKQSSGTGNNRTSNAYLLVAAICFVLFKV